MAQPLAALAVAIVVGWLLVLAIGDDPFQIYWILISGSLIGVPTSRPGRFRRCWFPARSPDWAAPRK